MGFCHPALGPLVAAVCLNLACNQADPQPRGPSLRAVFTAAQADRGRDLYQARCAGCHGARLEGGGVVSCAVGGKQYVAVMSGRPSYLPIGRDPGAATVHVFGLP